MRVILKLGGAIITDKREGLFDKAEYNTINRLAEEIAEVKDVELILVHGAGSFGHPYIKKYGLSPEGISRTHLACERLCTIICNALLDKGLNPAPIHPFSSFKIENCNIKYDPQIFEELMEEFIPVTHGDVVRKDSEWCVLSGDDIVVELAKKLKADRVGFATKTQIYFRGQPVEEFHLEKLHELDSKEDNTSDVTGGMFGKLKKVMEIVDRVEVFVFNGMINGSVSSFLRGADVGTKILP